MRCRFVLRSFSIPLNLLHNFSFYCYYLFLSFRAPSYEFHFLLISIGSSDVKHSTVRLDVCGIQIHTSRFLICYILKKNVFVLFSIERHFSFVSFSLFVVLNIAHTTTTTKPKSTFDIFLVEKHKL